ncbi:hypothetical protein AS031_10220 [Pseudarthrobacter enclensis]|uniref:Uncharacterized protein n=1 Tax=Pseudarthrobacter enclensis TaxID=993070 RepID=A0A0V8IQA6_9MICC|nr:hypothetical protein AS031_10220 [Pseudarthrobacter enclensis]
MGFPSAYRRPSRTMPLLLGAGALTCSWSLRRISSMATVEQQATALAANAQPAPTAVRSRPASAGPIRPPSWKVVELTLMALRRYTGPTSSLTKTWRAGWSSTVTRPRTSAIT